MPWVKREGDEDFVVSKWCYDKEEVCLLNKLSNIVDAKAVGLYRDNGFGVLRNLSGLQKECKKKAVAKEFKNCSLRIAIQANLRLVYFFDA